MSPVGTKGLLPEAMLLNIISIIVCLSGDRSALLTFFIHSYFDYNKLTIVRGRKKKRKGTEQKYEITFFRGNCVVAKGAKLLSWPLPQCSYLDRK